ncbi:low molecular weight phosphatase family protein [Mycolicibacterium fluoranthenivorans]|nr:low molecular weight phosphatase family protein [Mycolicibacterium fluoranthenivorans]MCV7359266.1 low molecular weight phosphatase family protein [Mycolicibacterium fluoranthenivorans]
MHVLFVCTGNICRSPTAERLSTALNAELQIPGFTATSAGTRAVIGHPMHAQAARVLEHLGGDASGFVARHLTPLIANNADLVLTMTTTHRNGVLELAPRQLCKTFTLGEAALLAAEYDPLSIADLATLRPRLSGRPVASIPDPIGQDAEYFTAIGANIAELLPPILELCRRSAALPSD